MKSPEEALAQARARSSAASPRDEEPEELGALADARQVSLQRLAEWAVIEPEESDVYSTRRWGAPITVLKRLLVRLMRQYVFSVSGQQTRFNVYALGELTALQERVRALEEAATEQAQAGASSGDAGPAPASAPSDQ